MAPTRRSVLRAALGAGGLTLAAPLLAACGSDAYSPTRRSYGAMTLQLPWQRDVQFAGSYLADVQGHYLAEGFDAVTLSPYGSSSASRFALMPPEAVSSAQVIVGVQYRRSPYGVFSPAAAPVTAPAQLSGRRVTVASADLPVWRSFARVAGLSHVSVGTADSGFAHADAWFAFAPRAQNVLQTKGISFATLAVADHYDVPGCAYVVRRADLAAHRHVIKAFLRAEIAGWKDALADPSHAAQLALKYGAGLGLSPSVQQRQSAAQNKLLAQRRLFLPAVSLDARYDLGPLSEVYAEDPSMVDG